MRVDYEGQPTKPACFPVNVIEALSGGKGAELVQGGVSVIDEDDYNCSHFLSAMHKYAEEWISSVTEQEYPVVTP